jgi:hypothetical protein
MGIESARRNIQFRIFTQAIVEHDNVQRVQELLEQLRVQRSHAVSAVRANDSNVRQADVLRREINSRNGCSVFADSFPHMKHRQPIARRPTQL